MKRPTSVSVIAWILIVMSCWSMITYLKVINNPMVKELMAKSLLPISLQYVMMLFGFLVSIVSGIAMLRGQNWARFLYVTWGTIGLATGIVTSPMKAAIIPGLVVFVVVTFFLFRPKANDYFCSREAADNA